LEQIQHRFQVLQIHIAFFYPKQFLKTKTISEQGLNEPLRVAKNIIYSFSSDFLRNKSLEGKADKWQNFSQVLSSSALRKKNKQALSEN
jgi:hypothetical protein